MKKLNLLIILLLIIFLITIYGCKKEAKTSDIIISVLDENGKPLQDVNITLDGKSGKSDSQGKITFSKLNPGSYNLKATKEGFEDYEESVNVSEGEKKEIKVTLIKKSEFEEIKNYTDIPSFHLIAEYRGKDPENDQKIEIITEDYGKRQYLRATNLNTGKLYSEIFIDEDTAKIRYKEDGEFYEVKRELVGSIAESFYVMVNDLVNVVRENFNEKIKLPEGSIEVSIKKVLTEEVNNYSATEYQFSGETTYQNEKTKFLYRIWLINSGKYKNYPTKLIATMSFSDGSMLSYTINIFELGEAKVPKS